MTVHYQNRHGDMVFISGVIHLQNAERIGLFEVVFYDGCFMKKKRSGGLFHFIPSDKCQVVGNIYDNPELLEVENG